MIDADEDAARESPFVNTAFSAANTPLRQNSLAKMGLSADLKTNRIIPNYAMFTDGYA
jgi:hypothetical protein